MQLLLIYYEYKKLHSLHRFVRTTRRTKQVAQLWQRERARSLVSFRLTYSVIREIMHKIAFLSHPMCA